MGLIRQKTTRWVGPDGRRCAPRTPGARKVVTESRKWYGEYRDENGALVRVPLSANRAAAQIELGERMKKVELARVGVRDPFEGQRDRPIEEHISEFIAELRTATKGKRRLPSERSLADLETRLRSALAGVKAPEDITLAGVQTYLSGLRRGKEIPSLKAGQQEFTLAELAELLGVKPSTVQHLARKRGLARSGRGKKLRYPRESAERMRELGSRGLGDVAISVYAASLKRFTSWLARRRRLREDPLLELPGRVAESDHRHDRRALSLAELQRLMGAAQASQKGWRGFTGVDRYHLYLTACYTGYRADELAELTPESFALDGNVLCVLLGREHTKNAKAAVQPIPAGVADILRVYLASRPAGQPVWSGAWPASGAQMVRRDLEAAGIPYTVAGPDGPLYADFHALRHSYVALLDAAGISVKNAMHLARLSDPRLLLARYGRPQLLDLAGDAGRLPDLSRSDTLGASLTAPVVTGVVTGAGEGKGGQARATEGDTSAGRTTRHRRKASG